MYLYCETKDPQLLLLLSDYAPEIFHVLLLIVDLSINGFCREANTKQSISELSGLRRV